MKGLLDRIEERRRRSYPVGPAVVEPWEKVHGHDDELYVPESYGDYLVTSNEIFSAASLRARLMSSVPLQVFKGRGAERTELPDSRPAQLLQYVNPFWTEERLARMDELSMCVFGESVWAIEKDSFGQPKEIWWLKPSRVKPVPDSDDYLSGFLYESNVNGRVLHFEPDEIVWFRYPNPLDEYSALSPVSGARLAADTASAMMKANRNLHSQGLQIAGVLSPKGDKVQFTKEQAEELGDDLQRRFSGADKAHKWAVLRYEAEFRPVNISPKDAEFILGLGLTARQIYNSLGVPSPLLNDLEHATLANLRELTVVLWEHALVPDLRLRGGELREQFLPMFGKGRRGGALPNHVEHDLTGVTALQKSKGEAWDRDRQALESGAITINEWRRRQGLPPVPWGDVWWAPVNKAAVTDANSKPQGDTSPTVLPAVDGTAPADPSAGGDGRALLAALDLDIRQRDWSLR